jgi:methyltransferase-like protein/2-polyprenyl-3-methyl-5-hydroxy-6-metoxy-1,4-benzoquinol methylase
VAGKLAACRYTDGFAMSDELLKSYDDLPYESKPVYRTHPDGLATVTTLFGLSPPDVTRCRVLELGGASGGNLIPMALTLPGSEFVGIDLSPRQIADGQEVVAALGLQNVQLRAMNIMDVEDSFGSFDYIICHGVYSWVPPDVQERILTIFSRNLSPHGIAYISYNTYPGWHLRGMVRDMMQYHAAGREHPQERVQQARALLDFLVEALGGSNTTYDSLLKEEANLIRTGSDSYLFHEQLETFNAPVHFHEFAARAAGKGLRFVSEAQFSPFDQNVSAQVRDTLDRWAGDDFIRREQYLDFLRARTFRRSLLCHADAWVRHEPDPEAIARMHVSALARPKSSTPDLTGNGVEEFNAPDGAHLSTNHPVIKTALSAVFEQWPGPISFDALSNQVATRLGAALAAAGSPAEARAFLAAALLQCFFGNMVELHVQPPRFNLQIGARPLASALVRWQAAREMTRVTSLSHRVVELGLLDRIVVRHLDGQNDRAALLAILLDLAARDVLVLREGGQPLRDPEKLRALLEPELETSLRRIAAGALLVA